MHNGQWTMHNGRRVFLVLILVLILSGCGPLFQPVPIDYNEAGQIYQDQWIEGLRQMVVESCNAQPDPTACRAAWRAAVDATIDPTIQPEGLRQRSGAGREE